MGYNTTLMFLNDSWHEVMNNPLVWVDSINEVFREGGRARFGTTVAQYGHADIPRLYISHANRLSEFATASDLLRRAETEPHILDVVKFDVKMARGLIDLFDSRIKSI